MKRILTMILFHGLFFLSNAQVVTKVKEISGIYPHLAYYNGEGECGTGAVVPWCGRLWVITYGPHFPQGSSIIQSADQKAAVWAGVIDDLWKMGKPVGEGGPWKNDRIKGGSLLILT